MYMFTYVIVSVNVICNSLYYYNSFYHQIIHLQLAEELEKKKSALNEQHQAEIVSQPRNILQSTC